MLRPLDDLLKLPDNALVNEDEAAAVLHVAVQMMRNWRFKRRGPSFVRLGNVAVRYEMRAFPAHGHVDRSGGSLATPPRAA
jgi:hypothetical protein